MKSRWDEVKSEERRCTSAKVRRKKIHPRQMLEKSGNALFFQWFVQNLREAVERRTFASQNVKKMLCLRQFLTLRCRENSWSCDEKHLAKSKCSKADGLWWVRARSWHFRGCKIACAVARSTFASQNEEKLTFSERFLKRRCRKISQLAS